MSGRVAYYGGIVKDGLILDLDAAKRDSYTTTGITWSDISGNKNNGTLVNGPSFSSTGGGSLVFNGTNSYVGFNSISPISSLIFSISSVVSVDTSTVAYRRIVSKGHSGFTPGYLLQRYGFSTGIRFSLGIGSSTSSASTAVFVYTTDTFQQSQLYHLTMVSTGTYLYLYINGVKVNLTQYSGSNSYPYYFQLHHHSSITGSLSINSTDKFSIGCYSNNNTPNGEYWNGNIPQVQIYNRALSTAEVLQNYNATKGRYGL